MNKQQKAMDKELKRLSRQERAFLEKRMEKKDSSLNRLLAEKVPEKLQGTLDAAFAKAFALVFEKGTAVIEKSYNQEEKEKQDSTYPPAYPYDAINRQDIISDSPSDDAAALKDDGNV